MGRIRISHCWIDSLMWLGLASILAALLVPMPRQHIEVKKVPKTADKRPLPSAGRSAVERGEPLRGRDRDVPQYFPSGHEVILQNEADFINSHNAMANEPARASRPAHGSPRPN